MNVGIKSLHIENFKGVKAIDIDLATKTSIRGRNACGKTTIVDAVLWLLFGKNSQYVSDFELRPLNPDGTQVNYVEIKVSAILDIDGKEVELSKTQKQNWVKSRGEEKQEFKGNVNIFEIDGYPKKDAEYKAFISSIVSEDLFKMLTNPVYFPSMKWKEQREILMKFATVETDAELAKRLGGYDEILPELEKAPSTDDIQKKFKGIQKELKEKQVEIPVRIDELERQKVDADVAELEIEKKRLEEEMRVSGSADEISKLKDERFELEFKINDYARQANESTIRAKSDADNKMSQVQNNLTRKTDEYNALNREIKTISDRIVLYTEESAKLGENYSVEKGKEFDDSAWVFDESSTVCKMCGQKLQVDKINALVSDFDNRKSKAKADFENGKKKILNGLIAKGNELKTLIDSNKTDAETKKAELSKIHSELVTLSKEVEELESISKSLPDRVDLSHDTTYMDMVTRRTELDAEISRLGALATENALKNAELINAIEEVDRKLTLVANNSTIDERISDLQAELRTVAQKISDCDKVLYLLDTFIKAKLDAISQNINSKFKLVTFKLFDVQINGGVSETCECMVNGVPYSSTNSASKIQAGLDIISTLSEVYDVYAPIFIDNRESCTYIPDMKAQVVSLYVDDSCKELSIAGE